MENLYAIRDAFFWWAGVWASVTLGNHAICTAFKRRERRDHEQYRREFAQTMAELGREFLDSFEEGLADDTPEAAQTVETAKVTETPKTTNVTEVS